MTGWQPVTMRQIIAGRETWANDDYAVSVYRAPDRRWITMLIVVRADGQPIHDWRDLQQIKNDVAGPDVEAVELYPAMSRLNDTANAYMLFCYPPGQPVSINGEVIGNPQRIVSSDPLVPWAVQRPLPDEWKESADGQ